MYVHTCVHVHVRALVRCAVDGSGAIYVLSMEAELDFIIKKSPQVAPLTDY